MRWFFAALNKSFDFGWRSHRREFWRFWGWAVALYLLILLFEFILPIQPLRASTLFGLAMLLPGFAVTVRRMHDIDRNGFWALLLLLPVLGWLIVGFLATRPGIRDKNEWGPDPRRVRPIPIMPR
ncbi:DUF805 domain-containing protein [Halorhodospira halophila]|uniref:DUF805 domain-containing protein n=1 Tax=Halorhodospira halophila TaxID=1053 RepID=UPI00191235CB|nr:DUF805 domain-containing protein [Halorhodospira halophila]MBK5942668.1 hypothetical protein [Halorhodospira halophila]